MKLLAAVVAAIILVNVIYLVATGDLAFVAMMVIEPTFLLIGYTMRATE